MVYDSWFNLIVYSLGSGVQCLVFSVECSAFRVQGLGVGVEGSGGKAGPPNHHDDKVDSGQ